MKIEYHLDTVPPYIIAPAEDPSLVEIELSKRGFSVGDNWCTSNPNQKQHDGRWKLYVKAITPTSIARIEQIKKDRDFFWALVRAMVKSSALPVRVERVGLASYHAKFVSDDMCEADLQYRDGDDEPNVYARGVSWGPQLYVRQDPLRVQLLGMDR